MNQASGFIVLTEVAGMELRKGRDFVSDDLADSGMKVGKVVDLEQLDDIVSSDVFAFSGRTVAVADHWLVHSWTVEQLLCVEIQIRT